MQSILQGSKECFFTGATERLHKHHIFFGTADRKTSEQNGFWVWLRWDYHIHYSENATPHNNREVDLYLKRLCQKEYEKTHSRAEFMKLIGRNYL